MSVAVCQTTHVSSSLPNCTCSTTHNMSQAHISHVTSKLYWLLLNFSDICHIVCHYSTCDICHIVCNYSTCDICHIVCHYSTCDTHCDGTRGCFVCWEFYHLKGSRTKRHRKTEEEMEGPISFWGYKEQESNLILPEHDNVGEGIMRLKTFVFPILLTLTVCLFQFAEHLPRTTSWYPWVWGSASWQPDRVG